MPKRNKKIELDCLGNEGPANTITDEHVIPLENLIKSLDTDPEKGLCLSQVYERLEIDGPNSLTPRPQTPKIILFLGNLFGGFGILLLIGAGLCFIAYGIHYYNQNNHFKESLWLGIALIFVDFVTACFSFYQEEKCKRIINSFKNIVPQNASTVRDSVIQTVRVETLVPGDIILLKAGDSVPADIRLIQANKLFVDNSSLTGESKPQPRTTYFTHIDPLESQNLVFLSTSVLEGSGIGIVVKTGDRTFYGQIAWLASEVNLWDTPLNHEITHFIRMISIAALVIGLLFFIVSLISGYFWLDSVIFLISIMVAKVPEGLLATVTVALTLIAKKISKKNCLVKNLEAVESLGSAQIICTDKTGTITQNKLSISKIWINGVTHTSESIISLFEKNRYSEFPSWREFSRSCMLGSGATFKSFEQNLKKPINLRECDGNPSEIGFLKFMEQIKNDVSKYRKSNPRVYEIPFNPDNKYQVTVHKTKMFDDKDRFLVVMIGAPEIVISKCNCYLVNGETIEITKEIRKNLENACNSYAKAGERVLGICDRRLNSKKFPSDFKFNKIKSSEAPGILLKNMRFLGLASMLDPPRVGVSDAIEKCKSAGLRVIMITGDHPLTAKAIAKSVGIITMDTIEDVAELFQINTTSINPYSVKSIVVTGERLKTLTDRDLDDIFKKYKEIVFARTTPYQKVIIVKSLQRSGLIVAVTGDGVNDSPALRQANIGIAMGVSGSDVSKEAADMILLDDSFGSIVTAIEEGRLVFDNLKKSFAYIFSSKIPELMPFILHVLTDIPLPLGAITILCIDLGTDLIPAISLAYEKSEFDIMKRKPRDAKVDRLVNFNLISLSYGQYGFVAASAGFFTYTVIMAQNGFLPNVLNGVRRKWDSRALNDLEDSYGQEWTYEQRKILEYTCHTGFFVAVVTVQIATLLICKTRRNSLFQQRMDNYALNMGLFIEFCLAIIFCYTPGLNVVLQLYPIRIEWWFPAIVFALSLIFYDEWRKYFIRKYPNGITARDSYY